IFLACSLFGQGKRLKYQFMLSRDVEDGAASDQHFQAGAGSQQCFYHAGCIWKVLKIIEDQKKGRFFAEEELQVIQEHTRSVFADLKCARNCWENERGLAE